MGMSSKEKSRLYRERLKLDPQKNAERQRKKRESYHKNKKLIKDLTPQEKVNARVIWRLRKQEQRKRKKAIQDIIANTPPSSPSILLQEPIDNPILFPPDSPTISVSSGNKTRGRMKERRDRTSLYRENKRLKEENTKLQKRYEKYKKRAQRKEKRTEKIRESNKKLLRTQVELNKYEVLSNAIKERYQKLHDNKQKTFLKNILRGLDIPEKNIIIKDTLGLEGNIRTSARIIPNHTILKKKINDFFNRDDISRNTAGKNETVGRGNKKTQKRFLLDAMTNLYKTFKLENPGVKCSYFYFTKNRPYYIVRPTVDGREMCLCKTHTNANYKAKALRNKRVLETLHLSSLIMQTVCNNEKKDCMMGTCKECKNKKIKLNIDNIHGNIEWYEWVREEEIYSKGKKKIKAIKNVKKIKEDTINNLIAKFEIELKALKKHVFNIKNQYKSFRQSVDNVQPNEAVILVDFSENYNAKCTDEIQAHHFGGSRQQVTLHTVVVYVNSGTCGTHKHIALSFCTVSSCNLHQPAAIWAHLDPILTNILADYPQVNTIHFFSDGPFSQYRQKANFFLSCTKVFDYGFEAFTWSYFEAGHGKGPADGIGGYLKRAADNLVATGTDITNASEFYRALKGTSKVKLFFINKDQIDAIQDQIPKNIVPLVGTLHVHQVYSKIRGQLKYRDLSCFCNQGFCECLSPKIYHPIPKAKQKATVENSDDNSSDDNLPLNLLIGLTKRKDLLISQPVSIYKSVYGSSDTSDDDMDKEKQPSSVHCGYNDDDHYNLPGHDLSPRDYDYDVQQPSISGQNNNLPGRGDYLLVKVHGAKGKSYTYVCVAQSDIEDDGEIKVTFMKAVKRGKLFLLDQKDVSYVAYDDIIKKLPNPDVEYKRGEVYYKFSCDVDIFEK